MKNQKYEEFDFSKQAVKSGEKFGKALNKIAKGVVFVGSIALGAVKIVPAILDKINDLKK